MLPRQEKKNKLSTPFKRNFTLVMTLHLATRMAKFKIGEFEKGDLASRGVRWQKWSALLKDNCDWFGVTEAEMKVKALRIYGGERVRDLVDSLPEPEMEGDAFGKTIAKLSAFFLPKKNTDVLVARFRKMGRNDHETIMQYYARLRPEAAKCEFHDTELEISGIFKKPSEIEGLPRNLSGIATAWRSSSKKHRQTKKLTQMSSK